MQNIRPFLSRPWWNHTSGKCSIVRTTTISRKLYPSALLNISKKLKRCIPFLDENTESDRSDNDSDTDVNDENNLNFGYVFFDIEILISVLNNMTKCNKCCNNVNTAHEWSKKRGFVHFLRVDKKCVVFEVLSKTCKSCETNEIKKALNNVSHLYLNMIAKLTIMVLQDQWRGLDSKTN